MRKFRDKDFVETSDGIFFCIVGDIHGRDRVVAYPRYAPGEGPWRRDSTSYRRLLKKYSMEELLEAIRYLKSIDQSYTFKDPHIGVEMSCVPAEKINQYYSSSERMGNIFAEGPQDELEERVLDLVGLLVEESGVAREFFGLTGSMLVGLHHSHSDMDITVYGRDNFWAVQQAIEEKLKESKLERQLGELAESWVRTAMEKYPLGIEELKRLYERMKTKAKFGGTAFSVHGVRREEEVMESYGDRYYESAGTSRVICNILEHGESCLNPAIYKVETVKADSQEAGQIIEIASYDGTFRSIFRSGDTVEAFGKRERVLSRGKRLLYHRLLIGSFEAAGKEYIKLL